MQESRPGGTFFFYPTSLRIHLTPTLLRSYEVDSKDEKRLFIFYSRFQPEKINIVLTIL
jgi:hypothetical protein